MLGALAAAAIFASAGVGTQRSSAEAAGTAAPVAATGPEAHARTIYLRDCAWCHGDHGEGSNFAPDFADTSKGYIDFMLRTGRMPLAKPGVPATEGPPAYDSATIKALVDYVGTFGTGEPVPTVAAGDPTEGEKLFIANCAACHSSSGTGVILTNGIRTPQLYHVHPTQIAEAVRNGPGSMPPFSETTVDNQQLNDLVSYVHRLGPRQVKGGASLDQYGPITEGLFLWLLPVPVLIVALILLGKRAK